VAEETSINAFEHKRWNDEAWVRTWPRREVLTATVTPYLVDVARARPGEALLDVGTGGGGAALDLARLVDPGPVVGVDISDGLLDLARKRAAEAQVTNVSFVKADVQVDPIPGSPFTLAVSQFGVMFFEQPVVAFENIRVHLKPRGRLAFVCWLGASRNPWHTSVPLARFLPPPQPPPPGKHLTGPFALGDIAETTAILEAAGFTSIRVREHDVIARVPESALFDGANLGLTGIGEDRIQEVSDAVREYLAAFSVGEDLFEVPLAFATYEAAVS
jgi:SAM-dependent methyltransferase